MTNLEHMPIDLVLVRHGESEGNLAQRHSRRGNDALWTEEFSSRHTSYYRLTDRGRLQAAAAGEWIKKNISPTFDAYYSSEYVRAQETAALLGFKNAKWHCEFYLREQDRGILGSKSYTERERQYAEILQQLKKDTFYVAPPGGESVANSCLRVDRVIETLRTSCSGQRVICVCHGNIMMAFRVRLERMSQSRYQEINSSKSEYDKIHNCQIIHYTRRDPVTGEIMPIPYWMRTVCPWDMSLSTNEWEYINRPSYTNEELLAEVNKLPQLVNNKDIGEDPENMREG